MRNNSLAMLATVTGVGILAWWIGYFDPETCKDDLQQPGWTSCESIANTQNLALIGLIVVTVTVAAFLSLRNFTQKRKLAAEDTKRLTTR